MDLQSVLAASQAEATADAAARSKGGFINDQRLPIGEHTVRLFVDTENQMFRKWGVKWAGKGNQADPRSFDECPEGIRTRIDAALAEGNAVPGKNEFYKADFWVNMFGYMQIIETSVKNNDYFKAGGIYACSFPMYVRDAILAGISQFASNPKFSDDIANMLDITKDGIAMKVTLTKDKKATCFPDVGGKEHSAPDMSEYREGQWVPLSKLFTYHEESALKFADEIENAVEALKAKTSDVEDAQTPPEESAPAKTEEVPAAPAETPAAKEDGEEKPF